MTQAATGEAAAPTSGGEIFDCGPLPIGGTFAGRYVVQSHLGCGGMGHVYEVRDEELSERVALKVLARPIDDGAALKRFRDEVRLARMVTHKNVARTYDIGLADGLRFITMELVGGDSLRRTLRVARAFGLQRAAMVASAVADGLAAAHEVGVVHRDLKPGNVMMEPAGRVVLIDFGVAKSVAQGRPAAVDAVVDGTLDYMAPEQLAGEPADAAIDVYALGLILFEALAGERAFIGAKQLDRALQRLRQPAPDLRTHADVPKDVAELVARCLMRDPALRPSAHEVAQALAAHRAQERKPSLFDLDRPPCNDDELTLELGAPTGPMPRITVTPFTADGDAAAQRFATAFSNEVVDVLCSARGLRVVGIEPERFLGQQESPRAVGQAHGACYVVSGSVQEGGDRVRVSARLYDVEHGQQIWSDKVDAARGDILAAQDRIARRIGEAMRVELVARPCERSLPEEAIAGYLEARRLARPGSTARPAEVVAAVDRCLALAPGYAPAIATRAVAASRAWLFPYGDELDWPSETRRSVHDALDRAPFVPDTHVAAAHLALAEGRAGDAARAYRRALELAPSCALAMEGLGRLEMEAGLVQDGARRIRQASIIDPACAAGIVLVARACAMRDRIDEYARALGRVERMMGRRIAEQTVLQMRVAVWRGEREAAEAAVALLPPLLAAHHFARPMVSVAFDGADSAAFDRIIADATDRMPRPRFAAVAHQFAAEAAAGHDVDAALCHVEAAAAGVLLDIEWMDRCPALAPLRWDPRFADARDVVAARAAEVAAAVR